MSLPLARTKLKEINDGACTFAAIVKVELIDVVDQLVGQLLSRLRSLLTGLLNGRARQIAKSIEQLRATRDAIGALQTAIVDFEQATLDRDHCAFR